MRCIRRIVLIKAQVDHESNVAFVLLVQSVGFLDQVVDHLVLNILFSVAVTSYSQLLDPNLNYYQALIAHRKMKAEKMKMNREGI